MSKVLVVDDDKAQRLILKFNLEEAGYRVIEAENGRQALNVLSENPDIRILITDLAMPLMNGYDMIREIREREIRYTYIIMLTSMEDRESLLKALYLGADDYLTKPVFPDELKLRVQSGSRLLKLESQEELVFSLAKLAEFRSDETGYHLERVQQYMRILSQETIRNHPKLKLNLNIAEEFARVSPLHDIGKVAIPDNILHKPGRLTKDEFEIMKTHASIGGKLIKEIYDKTKSAYLLFAYEIAMYHHEKWNGSGYPEGLSGDNIPLSARIMALADVYDALTSNRCYKTAFTHEQAKTMIIAEKGKHFDPRLIDSFLKLENQIIEIKNMYQD